VTLKSAYHNGSFQSFYVFVADASSDVVDELRSILKNDTPWLSLFGPEDLGLEQSIFMQVFSYFNRFEISNLAKYVGLSYVLSNNSSDDVCVFVDSDTLFFGDVCPLIRGMGDKAVYLTPQLLEPTSSETEHDVMTHGWINAGFMAFNLKHERTAEILEWLIDRISKRGHLAPHLGLSCDQTWVSALPILFRDSVLVSEYKGLNVAYWNLNKRPLKRSIDNEILAGEVPLIMFHFSGFDESDPKILSKHANVSIEIDSILGELCNVYREDLHNGQKIREHVNNLKPLSCSNSSLESRIQICSTHHKIDIYKTMVRPGVFSKMGSLIDSILRKFKVFLAFKI
jgi:hypothetical protein